MKTHNTTPRWVVVYTCKACGNKGYLRYKEVQVPRCASCKSASVNAHMTVRTNHNFR